MVTKDKKEEQAAVQREDLLLIFIACHGKRLPMNRKNKEGTVKEEPVLLVKDTTLRYAADDGCLPLADIFEIIRESRKKEGIDRVVLILDACKVGLNTGFRGPKEEKPLVANPAELAHGAWTLYASTSHQNALEWESKKHGVFTYYVLQGLRAGREDFSSGQITFGSLCNYVTGKMMEYSKRADKNLTEETGAVQLPTYHSRAVGDVVLAPTLIPERSNVMDAAVLNGYIEQEESAKMLLERMAALLNLVKSTSNQEGVMNHLVMTLEAMDFILKTAQDVLDSDDRISRDGESPECFIQLTPYLRNRQACGYSHFQQD